MVVRSERHDRVRKGICNLYESTMSVGRQIDCTNYDYGLARSGKGVNGGIPSQLSRTLCRGGGRIQDIEITDRKGKVHKGAAFANSVYKVCHWYY